MDRSCIEMEDITEKKDKNKDVFGNAIGEFGTWHMTMLAIVVIPTKLSAMWSQIAIIFLAPKTTFNCVERTVQDTVTVNSTCYSDCVKYEYSSEFDNTIISEWDLICDRRWLANVTQTVCMFGILVGSFLFGYLGDRYGRRPALLFASMLQLISSFALPFASNFWVFTSIRFFIGTAAAGIMIVPFTFFLELTGSGKRELVSGLANLPVPVAEMIMPLFAYYLKSWNTFSLGIAIPNLLFLVYFFVIPESPKWLISTGQLEKASDIMTKVAKSNHLPHADMMEVAKRISNETRLSKSKVKASYLDLVTRPSIRTRNLCSCVSWFILGLSYYGSNQYIGQTSSNVFVTIVLAGVLQIPGIFISQLCCKRFGRRITLISFLVLCAVSNGMLAFPEDWFYVKLAVGSLGVSAASGAFSAMYMFTTELFPTVVRSMALGASSMSSRVGSMLAPFVAGLGSTGPWVPPAIFATVPLVAAVACFCLPETKGVKMADVLED